MSDKLTKKILTKEYNPIFDVIKGIAIIAILIHHVTLGQDFFNNQTYYKLESIKSFLYILIWYLWVYAGKFGNTLFIGTTALLLARSYALRKQPPYGSWVLKKLLRIYLPYLLLIPISIMILNIFISVKLSVLNFFEILSGFQPYFGLWSGSLNGAWWYISLVVPLYFVSPLLIKIFKKIGPLKFILISGLINIISWNYSLKFIDVLPKHFNEFFILNHLLTISLGISLATKIKIFAERKKILTLLLLITIVSFFFLVQMGNNLGFPILTFEFLFSRNAMFIGVILLVLLTAKHLKKIDFVRWLGQYTYPIFLSNLLVLTVVSFALNWGILFILTFFVFSTILGWVLQHVNNFMLRKIDNLKKVVIYITFILISSGLLLKYPNTPYLIITTPQYILGIYLLLILIFLKLAQKQTK